MKEDWEEYNNLSAASIYPSPPHSEENFGKSFLDIYNIKEKQSKKQKLDGGGASSKNKKYDTYEIIKTEDQRNNEPVVNSRSSQSKKKREPYKKFLKIYPNLSKIHPTGIKSQPTHCDSSENKSSGKTEKESRIKVRCNMCNTLVKRNHLSEHLFFGTLKCLDCGWTESECMNFFKRNNILSPENEYCSHVNLQWQGDLLDNIKNWLGHSSKYSKEFKNEIKEYLEHLAPLSNMEPWVKAFSEYKRFQSEKRKFTSFENIDLPADERYLICKKPIEECANCYTPLSLKNFVFHLDSTLIQTVCDCCDLIIFFVLDPPDGSPSPIQIR